MTSSKPSAGSPPEFFFDRSLGKRTAASLRDLGWVVHLATDHFPDDAQHIDDVEWMSYGLDHGWGLLSKDRRIRYLAHERAVVSRGSLFMLSNGNLTTNDMTRWLCNSRQEIERVTSGGIVGIWVVYEREEVLRWPETGK